MSEVLFRFVASTGLALLAVLEAVVFVRILIAGPAHVRLLRIGAIKPGDTWPKEG